MARKSLIFILLVVVFVEMGILVWGAKEKDKCLSEAEGYTKWRCYEPYFKKLTNETSAHAAMAEAIRLRDGGVFSSCHIFGHLIGETNLEKHDFDTGKAFSSCTRGCVDGCFHGVMERYIRNEADPYNIIPKLSSICDGVGTDLVRKRQCIHGVGHGLLAHNYLSTAEAINACNAFESEETDFWVKTCTGAAAMENMDQYLIQDLDEEQLREAIPQICEQIESAKPDLLGDCIGSVALGFMYYTGYDVQRSEGLCEEFPSQERVDMCKEHVLYNVGVEERDRKSDAFNETTIPF